MTGFTDHGVFLQEDGSYRYRVAFPDFVLAHNSNFDHWEKDRFLSMERNLRRGNVLFDVGSELGWMSAIYAGFVGAENMCLFEHTAECWPTIRQTWEANALLTPLSCYRGFVSNRTVNPRLCVRSWPEAAFLPPLESYDTWSVIHGSTVGPELTLDDFSAMLGMLPTALTIDVEGAEMRVLRGAQSLLTYNRPLVWASLHPEKRLATFGTSKRAIREFMLAHNYVWQYLGVDHEEHYLFYPRERAAEVILVESPWGTYGKRHLSFEEAMPDWQDTMGMPYAKQWGSDE